MKEGKTDEQILHGLQTQAMGGDEEPQTRDEIEAYEDKQKIKIEKELRGTPYGKKLKKFDPFQRNDASMAKFEEYQDKSIGMFEEEEEIIYDSWKDKERTKRLLERQEVVRVDKPKRSLEPSESFGPLKELGPMGHEV
jgi:hypothetical protein